MGWVRIQLGKPLPSACWGIAGVDLRLFFPLLSEKDGPIEAASTPEGPVAVRGVSHRPQVRTVPEGLLESPQGMYLCP